MALTLFNQGEVTEVGRCTSLWCSLVPRSCVPVVPLSRAILLCQSKRTAVFANASCRFFFGCKAPVLADVLTLGWPCERCAYWMVRDAVCCAVCCAVWYALACGRLCGGCGGRLCRRSACFERFWLRGSGEMETTTHIRSPLQTTWHLRSPVWGTISRPVECPHIVSCRLADLQTC
jgi:hypothetical protein